MFSGSKEDTEDQPRTDVDSRMDNTTELRMESESPSSELDKLHSGNTSDNESMESGKSGSYDVSPENTGDSVQTDEAKESNLNEIAIQYIEPSNKSCVDLKPQKERKSKADRRLTDSVLLEMHSSDDSSGGKLNETFGGSRPSSAASSGKSGTPGKEKGKSHIYQMHLVM